MEWDKMRFLKNCGHDVHMANTTRFLGGNNDLRITKQNNDHVVAAQLHLRGQHNALPLYSVQNRRRRVMFSKYTDPLKAGGMAAILVALLLIQNTSTDLDTVLARATEYVAQYEAELGNQANAAHFCPTSQKGNRRQIPRWCSRNSSIDR